MKMIVPKAPWSAVASATAFSLGFQGGSFAAAVQGGLRVFIHSGEPKDHGMFARIGTLFSNERGEKWREKKARPAW
jgi:hypothetical protein